MDARVDVALADGVFCVEDFGCVLRTKRPGLLLGQDADRVRHDSIRLSEVVQLQCDIG
ncbi:MAG: hypothetical protein HW389_206, partial [Bacteroidetes bacterium]|nr:hypothetical protein [Bacteroidota bacterium]